MRCITMKSGMISISHVKAKGVNKCRIGSVPITPPEDQVKSRIEPRSRPVCTLIIAYILYVVKRFYRLFLYFFSRFITTLWYLFCYFLLLLGLSEASLASF